ncbi:hypothetical protein MS5N3_16090 [Marinobacter salsuginis]|uniref:Uncharacterized protein n=1 Tax=Marinobacter salsuginis TaxID=418719 RepID=A0A5M3PMU1_9GAMM|nr:hypothetical protein MS5N3_16090 [Marinobacter salsuginis]
MEIVAVCHHGSRFAKHIELQFEPLFYLGGDSSSLYKLLLGEQLLKIIDQGFVGNSQHRPDGGYGSEDYDNGQAGPERK